jgi:hypothetical protein
MKKLVLAFLLSTTILPVFHPFSPPVFADDGGGGGDGGGGAQSANDRVRGVYVHGLFADDRQRAAWLD